MRTLIATDGQVSFELDPENGTGGVVGRVAGPAHDEDAKGLVETECQSWPRWDQEIPVLVLRPIGGGWEGTVLDRHQNKLAVRYDSAYGLVFQAALPG